MKLEQLPDDFTPEQFRQLDKESLDRVDYTKMWLRCECKGCENGTIVRDYGLAPWYWIHRNSKAAEAKPGKYWFFATHWYWLCGKHNKIFRRLAKRFDMFRIEEKFLERGKQKIVPLKINAGKREGARDALAPIGINTAIG